MIIFNIILIICVLSFIVVPILDVLGFKLNDFLIDTTLDEDYFNLNLSIEDEEELLEDVYNTRNKIYADIYTKIEQVIPKDIIVFDDIGDYMYLYDITDKQLLYTLNMFSYETDDPCWYLYLQSIYHDKYGINHHINSIKSKPKFELDNKLIEVRCAITNELLTDKQIKKSKWCKSCKIVLSKDSLTYNNGKCIKCNSEEHIKKKVPKKLLK